MNEKEAREKWCPFARVQLWNNGQNVAVGNVGDNALIKRETRCIASDCMAWRFANGIGETPEWGFCGLAGKP